MIMKKQEYQKPSISVHVPACQLLSAPIGVSGGYNGGPIEGKSNTVFEEESEENYMWGRVWGRVDDIL